ncbi:MAG: hypothetical protein Q9188_005316 [Gyalolechia gomerana]
MVTGLKNVRKHVNNERELWNATFGDGTPGDFERWYIWDPTPQEADQLVARFQANMIRPSDLEKGNVSHILPRYVRLSDSALGVVVQSQAPGIKLGEYWPLDFTSTGKLRKKRESFGHAWVTDGHIAVFRENELHGSLEDHPANEHMPTTWVNNFGDSQSSIYGTMAPGKFKNPGVASDSMAETAETEEEPARAGEREMDDDTKRRLSDSTPEPGHSATNVKLPTE